MPFGKKPCEHDPVVGCDECRKQRQRDYLRDYQRRRREDPAERAKDNETAKRSYRKRRENPEKLEEMRTYERERSRRRNLDSEYREKNNARNREYYDRPDVQARHSAQMKAYRERSDVQIRDRSSNRKRRGKIVFAVDESEASLIHAQNGMCAAHCGTQLSELGPRDIHVDHDHSITDGSPNVRGVLCRWCNLGLGNAQDMPGLLYHWVEYLEAWEARKRVL